MNKAQDLTSNMSLPYLTLLMLLSISACNGGLIGSGTGPKTVDTYQMRSMPEKTAPSIPSTLADTEKLAGRFDDATPVDDVAESATKTRSKNKFYGPEARDIAVIEEDSNKSVSWSYMRDYITNILFLNVRSQEIITLIDSQFLDIERICAASNIQYAVEDCIIEAGRIQATYTQAIVNRIIEQYTLSFSNLSDYSPELEDLETYYNELVGTTETFGKIHFNPEKQGIYEYELTTKLESEPRSVFTVRWTEDRNTVETQFVSEEGDFNTRLNYEATLAGERLVVDQAVFVDYEPEQAQDNGTEYFDAAITSAGENIDGVLMRLRITTPDITLHSQGLISNTSGYSRNQYFATNEDLDFIFPEIISTQESFQSDGRLLAYGECQSTAADRNCSSEASFTPEPDITGILTESPEYFTPAEFLALEIMNGASAWKINNLPEDIVEYFVVDASEILDQNKPDFLCAGAQIIPGESATFCSAPIAALDNTVVIYIDEDENFIIIEGASLIQEQ